jgi:hypothetical protein
VENPEKPSEVVPVAVLSATSDENKLVPCPLCRELIDAKARLCKHCKSDLSWRRYFSFSQTTLALVTALIAVIGTVGPQIKVLFQPDSLEISAVLASTTASTATFQISNYGAKNVFFEGADISVKGDNARLLIFTQSGRRLIAPGSTASIELRLSHVAPGEAYFNYLKDRLGPCVYTLHMSKEGNEKDFIARCQGEESTVVRANPYRLPSMAPPPPPTN